MSNNPSAARSGAGALAGSHGKRPFAETNPHTLVGLQKVKVQLEKEISKLDKQQATAVTNIANHQQAMKMTWRQLQHRRVMESPSLSRSKQDTEDLNVSGQRRGLFHSNTKLFVRNTPGIYHPETEGTEDDNLGSSTATGLKDAAPPTNKQQEGVRVRSSTQGGSTLAAKHLNSPYISSPYNFRRDAHYHQVRISSEAKDKQHTFDKSTSHGLPESKVHTITPLQREPLKLPPVLSSSSQPQLVTSSGTIDKKTLLKASAIIGGDLTSHSAASFKGFYSKEKLLAEPLLVSTVQSSRLQRAHINHLQDGDQEKKE